MIQSKTVHKTVLLKESISFLKKEHGIFVDATLGGGGHSIEILKNLKSGKLICFDLDIDAIERFKEVLLQNGYINRKLFFVKGRKKVFLFNSNFVNLKDVLTDLKINFVDGIIADLGVSSDQIEDPNRGFSFKKDTFLDMRMDKRLKVTAKDLVNGLYESELEKIFFENDEKFGKRIARQIVFERGKQLIESSLQLKKIIMKALPINTKGRNKSVARVFQALRIAVNSELSSLSFFLPQALGTLATDAKMVVISFHSGEDRIVKKFLNKYKDKIEILTKKPVTPSDEELKDNFRAKSAKLRAFKKL